MLDPTADRRLVELALSVPENLLVRNGDRRWLARDLLRTRVPLAVLDERRRGFQAADWPSRIGAEAVVLAGILERAAALGVPRLDESAALLQAIAAGFDEAMDGHSRGRLVSDLAAAAFALSTARASGD